MLDHADRKILREAARQAIETGLEGREPETPALHRYTGDLREPRASFVTLEQSGRLRGCIGSLEARRPLVADVMANAHAAAFRDPRFAPLCAGEFGEVGISISVLSLPERLAVDTEDDLLQRLRPGVDGLILELSGRRGTFLPSVWDQLPEPRAFVEQLKRKAGLPADFWSPALQIYRYTTDSFQ